jgi:hypothetical protein
MTNYEEFQAGYEASSNVTCDSLDHEFPREIYESIYGNPSCEQIPMDPTVTFRKSKKAPKRNKSKKPRKRRLYKQERSVHDWTLGAHDGTIHTHRSHRDSTHTLKEKLN